MNKSAGDIILKNKEINPIKNRYIILHNNTQIIRVIQKNKYYRRKIHVA
jgi:hypothetical protein